MARALRALPVIRGEFAAGRLSYAKVRALTRIADADSDASLAEMAGPMTANQLERFARAHRTVTRNMDEQARIQRRLTWRLEEDGSLSLSARLPPERRRRAADRPARRHPRHRPAQWARRPPRRSRGSATWRPAAADHPAAEHPAGASAEAPARPTSTSLADALVAIAEAYLASKARTAANPDVYQVIIHATPDMLTPDTIPVPASPGSAASTTSSAAPAGPAPPTPDAPATAPPAIRLTGLASRCHVEDGPAISRAALQMIACDAVRSWITTDPSGQPLNVGRRRRDPTPAIRRALNHRDNCRCRYPGCHRRATQAHHIQWWIYDGETALDNLISLCKYHHRLIHDGKATIATPAPGVFTFHGRDGTPIPNSPPLPPPDGPLSAQHDAEITPDTIVPPWYGERLDLDYAIAVLFANQQVRQAKQEAALAA